MVKKKRSFIQPVKTILGMAHVSLILEDVSGFAGFVLLLKIMTVIYQNEKTAMALRSGMNHTKVKPAYIYFLKKNGIWLCLKKEKDIFC